MPFEFRPAKRESVGLLIGLSGASGAGKTYTAMRLAKGIARDRPFAVIDTEAGRAKHYAEAFRFDHGDLRSPFRPDAYTDAIVAADAAGYPVIIVDSMSHEWAGEDGILDWQEAELDRMAGSDWKKRDACKMAAWIQPKMAHKKMVQRLLQVRAHLILCFRAEPKIEMVRGEGGKMEIREKHTLTGLHGWVPITEKNLPYELTASLLFMADHPGVPLPIKLQEQHRAFFPLDRPVTEASGSAIATWARGESNSQAAQPAITQPELATVDVTGETVTRDQRQLLDVARKEAQRTVDEVRSYLHHVYGIVSSADIRRSDFAAILGAIQRPGPLPRGETTQDSLVSREAGQEG